MRKLLLIILVSLFIGGRDCRTKEQSNSNDITEDISDDDETCHEGMDLPINYMQSAMDALFSRNKKDVEPKFLCFSRGNEQEPHNVTNKNFTSWNISESNFDPAIKTVFIIHGFKDGNAPWTRKMKDALILRENCNVCIVEYGNPSETYTEVLKNVPLVGKEVALFLRNLMKSEGFDLQKVHIIGHSAGAQVAGIAAQEIKMSEKKSVGRITGLDPAGPGFYNAPLDQRLDATDASFVDVIHTNKGCSRTEGLGYPGEIGHFDFYPNGGHLQPGCLTTSQFLGKMDFALTKITFNYLFGTLEQTELQLLTGMLCSHIRSFELFTASILSPGCKFLAIQCSSWSRYMSGQCNENDRAVMGYYADSKRDSVEDGIHKKFYLSTAAEPPYCL